METPASTMATNGPSDPNNVSGIAAGKRSQAWSGSFFSATNNAKVPAEKTAVNGWRPGAALAEATSMPSGVCAL